MMSNQTFLEFIEAKNRVPCGFWNNKENQKRYLLWLGNKLSYETMEDWYNISYDLIKNNKGRQILKKYNDSPINLIKSVFPEYEWLEWKFKCVPNRFWGNIENQISYLLWLGNKLDCKTIEDWYKISTVDFKNNYGVGLLNKYNRSHINILKSVFPEHEWLEWKFKMTSLRFWNNKENQKRYLLWLGKKLGYKTIEDWYKVSGKKITDNYGSGLLHSYYNGSPINLIKSVFPEYEWLEWKFNCAPNGFWDNIENCKKYLLWLVKKLEYKSREEWYKLSMYDFRNNYGLGFISKYDNSVKKAIVTIFPEYAWDMSKFRNYKSESIVYNWLLENKVNLHIKNLKLHCRPKWANLKKTHNTYYEYDIYVELTNGVKIIIEIDGRQHYIQVSNWSKPLHNQIRDEIKQRLAVNREINVLRVNQEDIWLDKNNWEETIINFIQRKYENNDETEIYNCAYVEKKT